MDFTFTTEQELLRGTIGTLLSRAYDTETRNRVAETELGWSPDVWARFAEIGLLGLTFDERHGGMGAGPVEVMAVMTEIGRHLAPEPLVDCVFTPGALIAELGSDEQRTILDAVAAGDSLLAFAHNEPALRWPSTDMSTAAEQQGGQWRLTGRKNPVPHGDCADRFVVSAKLPDAGIGLFLVDGCAVNPKAYTTFDGRRAAQLDLDGVPAKLLGDANDATATIRVVEAHAQAALCAEALGAMEEALRLTTEYLATRRQFGVPLSAFQALTHRAADMYVSLEMARGMAGYLTMTLADNVVDPIVASRAKLQIGRSALHIGQEAIQMHGGIGITAEGAVGHYPTRLTAIEQTLGSSDDHLRRLVANVSEYGLVEL